MAGRVLFFRGRHRGEVANPVGVLQAWRDRRERLFSRDGRKGAESKRLRQAEEQARAARAQAQHNEAQARETKARLEELAVRARDLEQRRQAASEKVAQAGEQVERAKAKARRDELMARIAGLEKQGLAPASAETRARDLVNQSQAAKQRAQQAQAQASQAQERAQQLVPNSGLAALEGKLNELANRRAELKATLRHQDSEEGRLARRATSLRQDWGLEPSGLAAIDPQLPHRLETLRAQAQDTARAAEQAQAALAALPPAPGAPVWWLALAFIAIIGGTRLGMWFSFALMPWWTQALGGALILGGVALAVFWAVRRQRRKKSRPGFGHGPGGDGSSRPGEGPGPGRAGASPRSPTPQPARGPGHSPDHGHQRSDPLGAGPRGPGRGAGAPGGTAGRPLSRSPGVGSPGRGHGASPGAGPPAAATGPGGPGRSHARATKRGSRERQGPAV